MLVNILAACLPLFSIRILLISLPLSCLNSSKAAVLLGGVLKRKHKQQKMTSLKTFSCTGSQVLFCSFYFSFLISLFYAQVQLHNLTL